MNSIEHVAIIMDGNGRWAQERRHPRVWGHVRGSNVVSEIVEKADDLGIKALTLYAFSSENWSRPSSELGVLFKLLKKFIIKETNRIIKNQIRFKIIGDLSGLPKETVDLVAQLENQTKGNSGLKLTFAFGYGGRNEIVSAVNKFIRSNPGKEISCDELSENLHLPDIGDVDLLIRTGGDKRISNFLLWQIAYSELFFVQEKWPEFNGRMLADIINIVSKRERRFGFVEAGENYKSAIDIAQKNKAAAVFSVRS